MFYLYSKSQDNFGFNLTPKHLGIFADETEWMNDEIMNGMSNLLNFYNCFNYKTNSACETVPSVLIGASGDDKFWIDPNQAGLDYSLLRGPFPKEQLLDEMEKKELYHQMKSWYEQIASVRLKLIFKFCRALGSKVVRYATIVNKNRDHWVAMDVVLPNDKYPNGRVRELDHLYYNSVQGANGKIEEATRRNMVVPDSNKKSPSKKKLRSSKRLDPTTVDLTVTDLDSKPAAVDLPTQEKEDAQSHANSETETDDSESSSSPDDIPSASMWFALLFGLYYQEEKDKRWEHFPCDLTDMNTNQYKQSTMEDSNGFCLNHENRVRYHGMSVQKDAWNCGLYVILDLIAIMDGKDYERRDWTRKDFQHLRLSLFELFMTVSILICWTFIFASFMYLLLTSYCMYTLCRFPR